MDLLAFATKTQNQQNIIPGDWVKMTEDTKHSTSQEYSTKKKIRVQRARFM